MTSSLILFALVILTVFLILFMVIFIRKRAERQSAYQNAQQKLHDLERLVGTLLSDNEDLKERVSQLEKHPSKIKLDERALSEQEIEYQKEIDKDNK